MSRTPRLLAIVAVALLLGCPPSRVGTDDDDDATTPAGGDQCAVVDVLGAGCVEVATERVEFMAWCDDAEQLPRVVTNLPDWEAFLQTCDIDQPDPLEGLDWSASHVVGTLATAGGCNGTAGTSWLARCADSHQLSYWSTGCGECDAIWTTTHFLVVPASEGVSTLGLAPCVPAGEECEG